MIYNRRKDRPIARKGRQGPSLYFYSRHHHHRHLIVLCKITCLMLLARLSIYKEEFDAEANSSSSYLYYLICILDRIYL